jgi:hypothetical protein
MDIQRKKFRYSFKKDASTWYYADASGVHTSATFVQLRQDPLEWKETDLRWKRHEKYHGIFRSFVVPMTFARDAATILRHVYYTEGIEGKCQLVIEKLNATTQQYDPYYNGDIDFSQSLDTLNTFQASILDSGLAALIKAKESTAFEIPLLDNDCLKVLMDGITLRGTAHYLLAEQGVSSPITISNTPIIVNAGIEGVNEPTITNTMYQPFPATIALANGAIYKSKYAETITITFSFTVWVFWPSTASNARTFAVGVRTGVPGGTIVNSFAYVANSALSPGGSATYVVTPSNSSFTATLNAGDTVGIFLLMIDNPIVGNVYSEINSRYRIYGNEGTIDIYTEYRRPATTTRWLRQYQVFQKLVALMGNGAYAAASNYLSNPNNNACGNVPWNTLMTCGDAVRGLGDGSGVPGTVPASIKTTLEELQQDSLSRDMTGIGVEGNTMRMERLDYFYRDSLIIADVNVINNLQLSVALEYIWNTLKIGYKYRENEKLNGKDDPFLTHQYASAGIRVKKERDAISPYVASIVTHEYVRANLGGKKTTDSNNDNDTFIAEVSGIINSNGEYLLARQQNSLGNSMTGMLAGATAYNLSLTPKRNLLRNAPLIHTALHLLDNTILSFQTADQNAQMQSKIDATGLVIEKASIPVSVLDAPLFLPIIFQFETAVPTNISTLIEANPYGKIQFSYNGHTYTGFILEVGIRPADNAVYTWKLLASPTTDLSKLIH